MADDLKKLKAENERLTAENAELKQQLDYTREQFVRLMSRNLDLSDRIEGDLEWRDCAMLTYATTLSSWPS